MQTAGEIKEMERTIGFLRKAIHDKEAPLKLAQTRLEERTRRIDVELCNDPAMRGSVYFTLYFQNPNPTRGMRSDLEVHLIYVTSDALVSLID